MFQNALMIRTGLAALAAGGLWLALTQQGQQQPPLTVEKLADDLHVIIGSGGNVAVLTTDEGVILVDDKFDRNVPEILEKVKSITSQPVKWIVNTHHHGDHTGGNTTLIKTAGIVGHDNVFVNMVKGKQPGPPQVTFNDKASVRLGGKEVRAQHFGRGHTNSDSVVLFPAHRVLHMGDLYNTSGPFIDYNGGGSGVEWTDSVDKALQLDFDRVIPGHGPIMKKADLAAWNENFKKMRSKVSEWKHSGKTVEQITNDFSLAEYGWQKGAFWGRSVPGLVAELR
jgi:cyclase